MMAITEYASGTISISGEKSVVSGTNTLQTVTDDGVYQVFLDLSDMAAGENVGLKVKEKVVSGGSQVDIYSAEFSGTQRSPFVTPSLILMHGWDVTLDGTTGVVVPASIRRVA